MLKNILVNIKKAFELPLKAMSYISLAITHLVGLVSFFIFMFSNKG